MAIVRAPKSPQPVKPRFRPVLRRKPAPPPPVLAPLRFGPNVYLAHTQPGFEAVAWNEIAARYAQAAADEAERRGHDGGGGKLTNSAVEDGRGHGRGPARVVRVRELARRTVPDRVGMTIFTAPQPGPLRMLRTVEDVFALVGYRAGLGTGASVLERVRGAARGAPYIEEGVAAHVLVTPGSRAGRKLNFRVIARVAGEHEFRRVDFQRAVERGITERGDHTWRLSETNADIELWATMLADEVIIALRLSDERMRHRDYKVAHMPGSLRPSVAAALGWLSEPAADDVVLDPLCGAATVLIERAALGRYQLLIGSDHDNEALAAARTNIGPRYKPIELHAWDAVAIPLADASVSKIVTNLPWGIRHGSHEANRRLYPRLIAEIKRLLRPGGVAVMLTSEMRLMSELMTRRLFRAERIVRVSILGAPAAIYVLRAE